VCDPGKQEPRPGETRDRRGFSPADVGNPTVRKQDGRRFTDTPGWCRRLIEGPARSADPRRGRPIRRVTLGAPRSSSLGCCVTRPSGGAGQRAPGTFKKRRRYPAALSTGQPPHFRGESRQRSQSLRMSASAFRLPGDIPRNFSPMPLWCRPDLSPDGNGRIQRTVPRTSCDPPGNHSLALTREPTALRRSVSTNIPPIPMSLVWSARPWAPSSSTLSLRGFRSDLRRFLPVSMFGN
jgi:hypothetical protein